MRNGNSEVGVTTTYFIIRYRSRSSRIDCTMPPMTPKTTFHSALPTIMNWRNSVPWPPVMTWNITTRINAAASGLAMV